MQTLGANLFGFSLRRVACAMGVISVALRVAEWRFMAPDACAAYDQMCLSAKWPIRAELFSCSVTVAFIAWLISTVAPSNRYDIVARVSAWVVFAALLIWLLIDASTPFHGSIR